MMATNNAINNTLPTPFTVGATSVTSTGTQLNYLNALTAVPINKINAQPITATGAFTYTPTAGTQYAIFELQGAGGGSGGTTGTAGQGAVGSGGGGGGYQKILVSGTANLAAITGSVGAGGAAGAAGNNNGTAGGNTTLVINAGTTWTSGGGGGGNGQAQSAAAQSNGQAPAGGHTSGTNGTLILSHIGGNALIGFVSAVGVVPALPSVGGTSFLGTGTIVNGILSATGNVYGGGASGGANVSGANEAGAAGANGIVIVTEFISY